MRYKEFNRNAVLENCIPLFWKNGYRACAISDIVEATGVNRFSLYEEFGNKDGILMASLQLYKERYAAEKLDILNKEGELSSVLREFYESYLQDKQGRDGCFVIHIGTELADSDKGIKIFLKDYIEEIETLLRKQLLANSLSKENAESAARNLVGLFCTSTSFCLIFPMEERFSHIDNGIKLILNNN